jgi:hypothetical protein
MGPRSWRSRRAVRPRGAPGHARSWRRLRWCSPGRPPGSRAGRRRRGCRDPCVHDLAFGLVEAEQLAHPQRDQGLADDVLHRLPEAEVGPERQDGHQLGQANLDRPGGHHDVIPEVPLRCGSAAAGSRVGAQESTIELIRIAPAAVSRTAESACIALRLASIVSSPGSTGPGALASRPARCVHRSARNGTANPRP